PLIFYDRAHASVDTSSVEIDDYQGAYKAVRHLIDQGCRRIAHFAGHQHIKIYQERMRGYQDALQDHGLPVDDEIILEGNIKLDDGRQAAKELLTQKFLPDGLFSASDY